MIAAPTGSGKTGAFAIPTLQLVKECVKGTQVFHNAFVCVRTPVSTFVWLVLDFFFVLQCQATQ